MQSRNVLNLFMLLTVAALSSTVWFVTQNKAKINYLSSLNASQVNRIVIPRERGDIVLVKQNGIWRMEKPFPLLAHDFRVQTLLDVLQTPVDQSYAISELDISQLDLNPPRTRIRFNNTEISFGKTNPVSNKRYLLSNNRVYLVNDTVYPLASAEAASFVNLSLLEPAATVVKIALPEITLQKNAANSWQDDHHNIIAADTAQQLVDTWHHASAFAVHAYMLRANTKSVRIELSDNTILNFRVAQESGGVIFGRADIGVEYHFDTQIASELLNIQSK